MTEAGRAMRRSRVGRTGARFPSFVEFEDAEPAPDASVDPVPGAGATIAEPAVEPGHTMVGRTGARFNSRARRERRAADEVAELDAAARRASEPVTAAPQHAADHRIAPDDAPTRPIFVPLQPEPTEDDRTWVRPYVRTRGRTRSRTVLAVETLVSMRSPHRTITDPEHVAIAEVCREPRSVAEVAARVGVPLGVARVLIDDMATAELIVVHELAIGSSGTPEVSIMQRILDGLHRL